jgi:hypothetical protein
MATYLGLRGLTDTDVLTAELQRILPDTYDVVTRTVVRGVSIDAVVIGPSALHLLYARDWQGRLRPARRGSWRERLPSGEVIAHPHPGRQVKRTAKALKALLRDQLPGVRVPIHHHIVLPHAAAPLDLHGVADPPCVTLEHLPRELAALDGQGQETITEETRALLKEALVGDALTRLGRAAEPFIFRSGGRLGGDRRAWTLRQLIGHLDRHPEDGIYHLRNGSLEQWLRQQGDERLARLASEAAHDGGDPRAVLEQFLQQTGLVSRPRMRSRPAQIDMGYVVVGETARRRWQLEPARGRGYLYGKIQVREPWIQVDDTQFAEQLETWVTVDTDRLPVDEGPAKGALRVLSSASEEPLEVPVRVRVRPWPSSASRYLWRPAVGALVGALLGLSIGWVAARWAPIDPRWGAWSLWPILLGLWGLISGGVLGLAQPPGWPVPYALGHWLLRGVTWGVGLAWAAELALWLRVGLLGQGPSFDAAASVALLASGLGLLPAALDIARESRRRRARPFGRRVRRGLVGLAAVTLLMGAVWLFDPTPWLLETAPSVYAQGVAWLDAQGQVLQAWRRELSLHRYDRRAPTRLPTREVEAPHE